ncbi:universal stress protein [Curtobacterium flaccumfaciens]|uniref:universal stress protein n=1 Tax=Curtobacterium flaccumfaciens TaxID=2035 RepID=UPI003879EF5E
MPKQMRWSVAIDETTASWNTLQWLGQNAADGDTVRLVTVRERFGEAKERSTGRLTIARHLLTERRHGLRVEQEVLDGPTLGRLLDETGQADAVVIGGRRSDRLWAAITGRVAERVIAGARCPLVVVPERWQRTTASSILVGVEAETASAALEYAADTVARRGSDLVLVRAWEPPASVSPIGRVYLARDVRRWEHEGQLELDAAIRSVSHEHPDLRMRSELRQGRPAEVLLRGEEAAALIVIGRRHRSAITGSIFGSVGEHLVHHSRVPVCVVPQQRDLQGTDAW